MPLRLHAANQLVGLRLNVIEGRAADVAFNQRISCVAMART